MSSEAQDDEVIQAATSMGYQKLTEPDIETGVSLGPAAKGGSISMTKGFLATLLTANTCCSAFASMLLVIMLNVNGFTPRTSEFQPRLDPPSPPPLPPGTSSSCTIYHARAAVLEGVMHTMTADGLKEVDGEEGEIATEGDVTSLGISNHFAPTFFDFECLLANGTGDPCDAYVAEAFADQMFVPLRVDSLVRLWLSTIFLYSLAQIGGIPRPRFIDRRIDWPGTVFWLSWMVTQLCQFFVVGISLGMQIVAFFGVYERTAPCMVRVDNFTLLDEFAMVTFAAQPALLSKLLLLVIYGYLLSLGGLVFIGRNMNEVDFKEEASKTDTSLVQPIQLASVLYFISRWALYGICLGTVGGWLGWAVALVAAAVGSLTGGFRPPGNGWVSPAMLAKFTLGGLGSQLHVSLYGICLGTVGRWLGGSVASWAAALVAAAVGSLTGGFKRGLEKLSTCATVAKCTLGVLLALPILPNLVYLPLGALFLVFVKLSFAAGRWALDLIASTDNLNWARWKRLEALTKTAAAATKPAISWLAPLGSLKLSSGMSMVVQGLPYTETSLSTLAGGLACVLGCLALCPLVAYGTWAAEQGRLEPDYDVEDSKVDALQARPWMLWLLAAMPVVLLAVDLVRMNGELLLNRCRVRGIYLSLISGLGDSRASEDFNVLLTIYVIPFLLALGFAIFFTSQDNSYIERILRHAQIVYGDSFAFLATLQLDVSGMQPFLDSVMADMVAFTGDPLGAAQRVADRLAEIAADPLAPVKEVVEVVANMSRYMEIDASYFVEHSAALDVLNVALGLLKLLATYGRKVFALYDVVLGLFRGENEEGNEEDDGVVQVHECVADPKKAQADVDVELLCPRGGYSEDKTSLDLTSRVGNITKSVAAGDAATVAFWLKGNAVLTKLNLDGYELDLPKLRGTDPVTSLDFFLMLLSPASAIVIASLIAGNEVLTDLNLGSNRIGAEGAAAIAEALRGNAVLTDLNLFDNSIGDEGAKALAPALRVNAVLKTLKLHGNHIGNEGAKALAYALEGAKVLKSLVLYHNDIGDTGAIAIAEALRGNTVLTSLNVAGNNIGPTGATAIAEALRGNEVLTSLDVGHNSTSEEAALSIVRVERQRNKLTSLGLAGCSIGPTGAAEIAEYYVSGSAVLTNLDVRRNEISEDAAQQLATAVLASPSLELFGSVPLKELRANSLDRLDLIGSSRASLGVPEALVLAKLVEGSGVLTELRLPDNNIGAEGATAIAEALRGNEVLTNLNLRGNSIGAEGAKAIGEALAVNGVLTALNLCGNGIGDEGAKAIGEALAVNVVLTSLDVGGNKIGPTGATAIAEALRVNAVLTSLGADGNKIGPIGATAIAEALRVNGVLTDLDLDGNDIGYEGAAALGEALKVNGVLTKLGLWNNNLGEEGKGVIRDAVSGREGIRVEPL